MADLISYGAAAFILLAAIIKYRSIRPARPTPAQRHLLIMLAAFAPAHALAVPLTQAATAGVDPVPYATNLVSHALAMIGGNSMVLMLAHVLDDPVSELIRSRWRTVTAVLVAAVLLMTALLVASEVEFHGEFAAVSAQFPTLVAYQLVFLGFMAFCVSRFILLMRRYLSRPKVDPLMRWGIRVVMLSSLAGLIWIGWAILTMAMSSTGVQLVSTPDVVAAVIGAVSITLMGLGGTLSAVGTWLPPRLRRLQVRNALRSLKPFWQMVADVLPAVTFHDADLTDPEDILYRAIIEIRDAQLALTCYIPAAIKTEILTAIAAGAHFHERQAVRVEAALLAVAIHAYRAGCQPTDSASISDPSTDEPDVLAEASRLINIYAAMCHDTVVTRVTHRACERLSPDPRRSAADVR